MLYDVDLIRKKALHLYDSGALFKSYMQEESLFPYAIRMKKATQKEVRLNLSTLLDEVKKLERLKLYVEYKEFDFKSIGVQRLPISVVFESEVDLLEFLKKKIEFKEFCKAYDKSVEQFPLLKRLFLVKPKILLQNRKIIDALLDIVDFFVENPRPYIYIREISISGIDTKFIQKNRVVVDAFFSAVLNEKSYNKDITKLSDNGFEKKYGLKYELPLVRFRILDEALFINGISDISLTTEEFAKLNFPCKRVFIVENKITMLSFVSLHQAIVIFGNGYGVGRIKEAKWLQKRELFYWGDIDMDGFAILSQARGYFEEIKSLFMDKKVVEEFKDLIVTTEEKTHKNLEHLTPDESLLYERLFHDYYAINMRLEQEKVPFRYIEKELYAFR